MILEGVVTTLSSDGALNVAPMGPIVALSMDSLLLRPFQSSVTYANLKATRCGVFHVTDDVLLIARAVAGQLPSDPETIPATTVAGRVLVSGCRWYEFTVDEIDDSQPRTQCPATVVHRGRLRDFFGFNRAKHAVLEAAILATRTHILDREEVLGEFDRLRIPVEKTAGRDESEAFEILSTFVCHQYESSPCAKLS